MDNHAVNHAADIDRQVRGYMMGVTLHIARRLNSLEDRFKNLHAYLGRLESRPAFRKALS